MTKARKLMEIAYATYCRNEPDIAKDIFVLAMEDGSASAEFGQDLEAKLRDAVAAGNYEEAAECLDAMGEGGGEEANEYEEVDIEDVEDDDVEDDDVEAEPIDRELPEPELAPAQVASLVTLARKIRADGHPDLAGRITKALGL